MASILKVVIKMSNATQGSICIPRRKKVVSSSSNFIDLVGSLFLGVEVIESLSVFSACRENLGAV